MINLFSKLLNANEREIKRLTEVTAQVNSLEAEIKKLKAKDFPKETEKLKQLLNNGSSLDELLPRAYALVREVAFRVNKERHFDVQVAGAVALHQGKIAEQKTGEGKTNTASMPLYLNALTGRGVHLVTVNDYLVKVGVGWMAPIYYFLGLSTGGIIHQDSFIFDPEFTDELATDWRLRHLRLVSRKEAYDADITYGINSEFGFDYLRDNMASSLGEMVQRDFHYAIVDEVDSVLIDEARTPHIISAPDMEPTLKYYEYAKVVERLDPLSDYVLDEKMRTAHLTDSGIGKVEDLLGIKNVYENDFGIVHHIEAALKARTLYHREKDYIVRDNQVIIVDEFTGRLMPGRRWSEGIHQAVEAKENVTIQQESKTLATISLQNYFRKYQKLAGMTGTAVTEAEEFHKIYNLDVVVIPTHRANVRKDNSDQVYKSQKAKYAAVVNEIEQEHRTGRPILVGTTSIEKNDIVSSLLRQRGIPHQVLNAKHHEQEAMIISQAGKKGAVTVATNMAGRGVDIILGGNTPKGEDGRPLVDSKEWKQWIKDHDEVVASGGLHVLGTERHESRRIDNQLRGRSGRQGDPGSSRFFVALDDDIMRLFGGDQVSRLMTFFNIPDDQPLEHRIVTKAIEQAQNKVEQFNFDSRKHLLEYDDVMNKQREIIYERRKLLLERLADSDQGKEEILNKMDKEITRLVTINSGDLMSGENTDARVVSEFVTIIPFEPNSAKQIEMQVAAHPSVEQKIELLQKIARDTYEQREKQIGGKTMRFIEQQESLRVIDMLWMEHLEAIDDLREGIGLRGYAQRDPLVEYKSEAFGMFEKLVVGIDSELVHRIYKINVATPEQMAQMQNAQTNAAQIENIEGGVRQEAKAVKQELVSPASQTIIQNSNPIIQKAKPGRNDPCWCGKKKPDGTPVKYKHCHYPN